MTKQSPDNEHALTNKKIASSLRSSQSIARPLLKWFKQHGRHNLPWQQNPTPYRVWVSEIMLQQTQVTTVIDYYRRFMTSFPDLKKLALAETDEVLHHWSGLGYYARARNLHKTAKIIEQKHQGEFPTKIDEIIALPGIGKSTAGAIISFSMNQPATILDGNVKRVLTRYYGIKGWPGDKKIHDELWTIAEKDTPKKNCHQYNQAMMDLGATVCTRTKPICEHCPLQKNCFAYLNNMIDQFPTKKISNKKRRQEKTFMLIIKNQHNEILLEKRKNSGIWGGLWSLPELNTLESIEEYCFNRWQISIKNAIKKLKKIKHVFSHYDLFITPVIALTHTHQTIIAESDRCSWYDPRSKPPGGLPAPVNKLISHFARELAV